MNIKPIRTERDYEAALERITALMDARPGTEEGDELDILATLVEAYEERHHPIEAPDPVEAIRFRMEQQGYSRNDLAKVLRSAPRASEVMNRKRALSMEMVRALHDQWGIPADVLIAEYALEWKGER
jgi:HTH-type transcriptional regulator/antitoxin HigA